MEEANGDDVELRKNTTLHRRRISLSSILLILLLLISLSTTTRVSASIDESGRRVIEARSGQDLVWVVQLSDLHFSVHHPDRAIDFRNILGPALSLINPSLVFITGDLTDGKSKDMLTMKQNEEEWLEYESVMQDVIKTSGLNKTLFYDLRGNHDNFGVPSVNSSVDFFSKYSINGKLARKDNINTITLETSERKHLFVGVDTTMSIGLRGPTNLFGHPTDELLTSLDSQLSQWDDDKPTKPVTKISFGHFPLSFSALTHSKKSLRDVFLKHSVSAYLCGHLHSRFGKNLKRLHRSGGVSLSDNDLFQLNMRRSGGDESATNCSFGASPDAEFWEWEMGDWRKNRAVRIVAIDRGHVSYLDLDFKSSDSHKTIVLPTFPLDSRFMSTSLARHRYECQHMISSSYDAIRAIVFSQSLVVDVVARVYDSTPGFNNLVMEAPMRKHGSTSGASFYSLPWNYRAFEDSLPDRYWLQIEVTDIKGRSTLSELRPFSINGLSSRVSWTWNEFRVMGCQWAALYFPILWSVLCCLFLAFLIPKCIIVVFKKQYTLKKFVAKKGLFTLVLWILQDLCRLPVVWFGYVAYLLYLIFFPWFSGEVFTDSGKRTYMTIMGWVVTSSGGGERKHEYVGEPDVMVLVIPHLVFVVIPSWLIVCCFVAERELYKEHIRAVSGKKEDDHNDRGRKKRWQRRSLLFSKRRLVRKSLLLASLALYWKHFKMTIVDMETESADQVSASSPLPFARSYQVEALEKAMKRNTIVYLETGSGKTLIAIMLLRSYAYLFRKPSPCFSVFLVPQVVLVTQQAEALKRHTDLKVGMYWGSMGVDFWDAPTWKQEVDTYEVLVMTPAILLSALRHSFLSLNMIKVLIFDECHHARGNHAYACILKEFYHKELKSATSLVPRIFGMTASPVKTKGENLDSYWKKIHELESLMNSKVYTCANESVLAQFVPFSTPSFKYYTYVEIPSSARAGIIAELEKLAKEHLLALATLDLKSSTVNSIKKRLSKICSSITYCLDELGILMALKAAQSFSVSQNDFVLWGQLGEFSETSIKNFCRDASQAILAYIPDGPYWSVANIERNLEAGLVTSKIVCLVESLLGYSSLEKIRCIIFVERVIAAMVLESFLNEILPTYNSWKTKYVAGNNSGLQSQTRKKQNETVEDFRKGLVNIIVSTSILEEGLDVQSCNLVVGFDPASNICSFIQSQGRARMPNSDYLMMVERGDMDTQSRLKKYISGAKRMREDSLSHSLVPCKPLPDDSSGEVYRVNSTGAIVTLSSSVSLIYFYCSRLPSDEYFKPTPRFDIDKDQGICTLYLPKSCQVKEVSAQGNGNLLKQTACLKACIQLHQAGALTDHLVPDMVLKETVQLKLGKIHYDTEQPSYFPPELVSQFSALSQTTYHFYSIRMKSEFPGNLHFKDVLLGTRVKLEDDIGNTCFRLEDHLGTIAVTLSYVGGFDLTQDEVLLCRRFQITLFRVLLDHSVENLLAALDGLHLRDGPALDYLLVPSTHEQKASLIDWEVIRSVNFTSHKPWERHVDCSAKDASCILHTKDGLFCTCVLQNALVYTPHNGYVYCTRGILSNLNANSVLTMRNSGDVTYMEYYEKRHEVQLNFVDEPLLNGRHIFTLHNNLHMTRKKEKEHDREYVELPPELCHVILAPISVDMIYSYKFMPSVMQRVESLLIALNLKKNIPKVNIPTIKVLEAITTKKCQDQFHLESLETLGDSFLKYAVCQHLFQEYHTHHEGLLSSIKDGMISNVTLCKFGCDKKLQGFIRNECFEPKGWMVPGQSSAAYALVNDYLSESRNMYIARRMNLKRKSVADVVEALIGAYLSEGGELAALTFMNWVGIKVDFTTTMIQREPSIQAEKLVNVRYMESLLNYKFKDKSLLVEALTHGSYMIPEIPRCYQRLEFLGDSVLDYLITKHLYGEYPNLSPGLLTDMRSASVNNECYAQVAVKSNLHKHVLHASHDLHKHISRTVSEFERLSSVQSSFGWESEIAFPKVLGDVIESLAGAIHVDSGYNKEVVFACIKPLLGCMITPETVKLHPVRELTELCQKAQFELSKAKGFENGEAFFTVEVEAKEMSFAHTARASDKKMAKKLAYKEVLNSLKKSLDS